MKTSMELASFMASTCSMCGHDRSSLRLCYVEHPNDRPDINVATMGKTGVPHLHRECDRCRYIWLTETLAGMIERLTGNSAKS